MRKDAFFESNEENEGKFESLGAVYGHELHGVFLAIERIGVGHKRDFFQEESEGVFGWHAVVFLCHREELADVFETHGALFGAIFEGFEVADVFQESSEKRRE